jgi:hypothetical protein
VFPPKLQPLQGFCVHRHLASIRHAADAEKAKATRRASQQAPAGGCLDVSPPLSLSSAARVLLARALFLSGDDRTGDER